VKKQFFTTEHNVQVLFQREQLKDNAVLEKIIDRLDYEKGMVLSSGVDYPGRYNRWEVGFVNPPVEIIALKSGIKFAALNDRGVFILKFLKSILLDNDLIKLVSESKCMFEVSIESGNKVFTEEQRSHQPSLITPLNILTKEFSQLSENMLGFFGAFGYELLFEFESCVLSKTRTGQEEIYHLFFVDELYVVDKQREESYQLTLEFLFDNETSIGTKVEPYCKVKHEELQNFKSESKIKASWSDEDFAKKVDEAREEIRVGNVFEVVLSRELSAKVSGSRASLYRSLKEINPSPYEYFCQFGSEQIVGTSPEMFVRCEKDLVESCPISGTIKRGVDPIEDEHRIRDLLNSYKDEVELTMCTDVDRNDKSRICEPGSVELITRRSIEKYSGLFHTVDHVKGKLRSEFTGLDAFLSHMWAVTLTGSPKKKAAQIIENKEDGLRYWYGGSVGCLGFNGDVNSAITIRTINIKNDVARYRVGATLVWDSVGVEEAEETKTKATLFYKALNQLNPVVKNIASVDKITKKIKAVMIDHEDSFVHTLSSYFRELGVELETYRSGVLTPKDIQQKGIDLVVYSPGPGVPEDFKLAQFIREVTNLGIPQFGICLGLQGMVEAFGGDIVLLDEPRHGKKWNLSHSGGGIFKGIDDNVEVAAYHSLIANPKTMPECFEVTAKNEHGHIMAVRHRDKPLSAVQFHPESILTLKNKTGLSMLKNAVEDLLDL